MRLEYLVGVCAGPFWARVSGEDGPCSVTPGYRFPEWWSSAGVRIPRFHAKELLLWAGILPILCLPKGDKPRSRTASPTSRDQKKQIFLCVFEL